MGCFVVGQMLNGVYQNAAAMNGLESWNDSIAQNISQMSTPGYKKAVTSFEGVERGSTGVADSFGNTLKRAQIQTNGVGSVDFSAGPIKITNETYDFALQSGGFFELLGPDGQRVYTRDGQFHLNDEGELVSKQGFYVLSDSRNPIQLADGATVKALPDGTLQQQGSKIAALGIRRIDDPQNLIRSNGGFVLGPDSQTNVRHFDNPNIQQGALEESNVSATTEMVEMITVSRSFQLNQKVIQQYDDSLGKAIQALGGR